MKNLITSTSIRAKIIQMILGLSTAQAAVETHPAVQGEPLSSEYSVSVDQQEVPVYTASLDPAYRPVKEGKWDPTYSFASFEFSGRITVRIKSAKPLTALTLRPVSAPIPVKLEGNTATFTLDKPGNYLIERNGNGRKDPLLLFANPVEIQRPKPGSPGVIYYGPGRHNPGIINLSTGQTLYIAGGAIVTGAVVARGDDIKILGRGILENSGPEYTFKHMISLKQCKRVRIEGIIIRKCSPGWTLVPEDCEDVAFSNVKVCGSARHNDDGVDPVNTRNMIIEDCFFRTKDDCLAFKGNDGYDKRNCENITVTRTSLWSDECCAILLGDESRAKFMRNITIKDSHILFLSFEGYPKKFLMLHSGEAMRMENIRLENIDIFGEGQEKNLIEMSCEFNQYSKEKLPGSISNILLKNISVTGKSGPYLIVMQGFSDQYGIDGVTFDHFTINGVPLSEKSPCLRLGKHVKNIRFKP